MRKFKNIVLLLCLVLVLPGCFDDETQRVLLADNQQINTERNAFYAMTGILQQLQEIGDNYVIMGELRADLMDVTSNSSQELRDISEFKADSTNSFIIPRKYYAIINNCNNLINKIDTSIVTNGSKTLMYEMKAAKTIRAWTYLQLYQIFGNVHYYTQTMLDVKDQNRYTDIADFTQLSDTLIADLKPWLPADGIAEQFPLYGTIGVFPSAKLFIPTRFVLGELYLMRGDYALAANMYYQILRTNSLPLLNLKNSWNSTSTALNSPNWPKLFTDLSQAEQISIVGYSTEYTNFTMMPAMTSKTNYLLAPSALAIKTWEDQTYSISNTSTLSGDLRGRQGSYSTFTSLNELNDNVTNTLITKYGNIANYTTICRTSLIYLRYAEAINRYGKPNMAFTFLKYGLNKLNLENTAYVPAKELRNKENFMDFGQTKLATDAAAVLFAGNTGIRSRGCGAVDLNNSFKIPVGGDSITWVEDQLVTEYALETAFEGNRFNDLMRIANHRNDPTFLATKIAAKFPAEQQAAILNRLSDKKNWFLPEKK
jgi:hypothetical protein